MTVLRYVSITLAAIGLTAFLLIAWAESPTAGAVLTAGVGCLGFVISLPVDKR